MLNDPTFWVATAFIAFLVLIVYLGVLKKIAFSLDERTEKIKSDIEQAEQLCKEAQDLLSHYQKKQLLYQKTMVKRNVLTLFFFYNI